MHRRWRGAPAPKNRNADVGPHSGGSADTTRTSLPATELSLNGTSFKGRPASATARTELPEGADRSGQAALRRVRIFHSLNLIQY